VTNIPIGTWIFRFAEVPGGMNLFLSDDEVEPGGPFKRKNRAIFLPAEDYEKKIILFGKNCQIPLSKYPDLL
jgi:hypothetical protein